MSGIACSMHDKLRLIDQHWSGVVYINNRTTPRFGITTARITARITTARVAITRVAITRVAITRVAITVIRRNLRFIGWQDSPLGQGVELLIINNP